MKSVLITGVRGGIGSALAAYFNKKGYRIFGLDYQDVPSGWVNAQQLFEELSKDNRACGSCVSKNLSCISSVSNSLYYVRTDLTEEDSVKNSFTVVSKLLKAMEGIQSLNDNAVGINKIDDINGNVIDCKSDAGATDCHELYGTEKIEEGRITDKNKCGSYLAGIIHAAGKYDLNSLVEMPEKDFIGIFEINVFAIYRVNKAFVSLLKEDSRIVVTASELAPLDPLPFTGIYGITKTTIEKYCHSLRMELQLLGIKVIELRPGAVRTGLLDHSMNRIDSFVSETELYKYSSKNFRTIASSVESKSITPERLAEFVYKVFNKSNPRFIYNINRNPLLLLLNALPDRFQTWVIKQILIQK